MNLHLERLEDRLLLTATSVKSNSESLIIKLDAGDDDVLITGIGPNHVEVTINGEDLGEFTGIENIKITDKGGLNFYEIDGVVLGGNIDIKAAGGEDFVNLSDSNFAALRLNLGAGVDGVALFGNIVHYDSRINTGDGDDLVFLGGEGAGDNTFGDKLRINTGVGDDEVVVEGNIFQQQLYVSTAEGDDLVHLCENTYGDNVKANGGKGDDILESDGPGIRRDAKKFETVEDCLVPV